MAEFTLPEEPLALGRTAEVFDYGDGRILKLLRPGLPDWLIDDEADKAAAVHQAGVAAPAFLEIVAVAGRHGAVYARVDGDLFLEKVVAEPLRLRHWARHLGDIHADMLERRSTALPSIKDVIIDKVTRTDLAAPDKTAIIDHVASLPDADNVLHGDLHPANIMLTADGPVLIDWLDAAHGPPAADIARSLWLMSPATSPEGIPKSRVNRFFRRVFTRAYLSRVQQRTGVRDSDIDVWRLPVAAARIAENIDSEDALLRAEVRRLLVG